MSSRRLGRGFDRQRLRWLLLVLFLALAIPTAILVGQAWRQLKWEAFHQYRASAEELTARIDARLGDLVDSAERRSFAEFSFLLDSQTAASNVVQRSPLSNFPVDAELPGLLGHFQVDSDGRFSTPLLPASRELGAELGITTGEYDARLQRAESIRSVLAENRLVQSRQATGDRAKAVTALRSADGSEERELKEQDAYSQQVFDALKRARPAPSAAGPDEASADFAVSGEVSMAMPQRENAIGKLSDIPLDASLQDKAVERESVAAKSRDDSAGRRQAAELISSMPAAPEREPAANAPIRTFASEVDAFEFSILDSGEFVLFRNVWRGGERLVQGMLLDSNVFIDEAIASNFANAALAGRSSLIVAYEDDVLASFAGTDTAGSLYPAEAEELGGALLYRSRLGTPFDSLELVYSVQQLPPGPGSRILLWLSLVLALVFIGGFTILYRLGASQIRLARQQQDFVSAVSHELKTPLTSIRMYGEMLKEGWADDTKRQGYYEYIHDEAERLSRLITNVLQLANITHNEPQLNLKPVPVRQLMDNVESRISSQVERAGFTLSVRRREPADEAIVTIDSDCFLQVVINLVDNAIKFSRNADTKVIEIECKMIGGKDVLFSVRDYGPGVPKDQMQKIFQLFYRSESELTRETVGTGIGLAIVHQLTLAMHGSVDLVNTDPGAEFRLRFPVV